MVNDVLKFDWMIKALAGGPIRADGSRSPTSDEVARGNICRGNVDEMSGRRSRWCISARCFTKGAGDFGARRCEPARRLGRDLRRHQAEWGWPEHADPLHQPAGDSDVRAYRGGWREHHGPARARPSPSTLEDWNDLPRLQPALREDGCRQCRAAAAGVGSDAVAAHRPGAICWTWSGWRSRPGRSPPGCRAGRSSGSASPERWPGRRTCCSRTRRPPPSIPRRPRRSWICSSGSTKTSV